jgi:hypothetical protein
MAVDTFVAYVGVYPDVADAEADYQLVKDLHTEAGLIDAYDAAVVERRADGKVRITRKHETRPGSAGSWAAVWGWPPVWSWPCSRSPPSAPACWPPPPPAAPSWARWPATPPPA